MPSCGPAAAQAHQKPISNRLLINIAYYQARVKCDAARYRKLCAMVSLRVTRRVLDGMLVGAFAVFSLYVVVRLEFRPRDPAAGIGVVFAPWTDGEQAMRRAVTAGGRFVRFGGLPFIVIVIPDRGDYMDRVAASGALLIVDPQALAACLPFSSDNRADDKS